MAEAFPIGGQIDPKGFPFLLTDLHRHGATGSLKVDGPSYQKALYFRAGRILFGSSNDPRDQLGAILIESGKITPEQLEDVNSKVGPGNPLAKVLSDTGFVNQRELSEAARAKVERILSDVVAYTSGSFEFEDGVLPKGAVDLKLSTTRLVMAAVRRVTDRNFVLRHIESLDVVLAATEELEAAKAEIASETGGLVAHLDGERNLKEAASLTALDEFEAAKIGCALLFLGFVERRAPGAAGGTEDDALLMGVARDVPAGFAEADNDDGPTFDLGGGSPFTAPEDGAGDDQTDTLVDVPAFVEPPPLDVTWAAASAPAPSDAHHIEPPPIEPPSREGTPRGREAVPHVPEGTVPTGASSEWPDLSAAPVQQSRPSSDDLAALDVLLNSNRDAPAPKRKAGSRTDTWAPQFGQKPAAARGRRRSGHDRRLIIGGVAATLVAAAGAAWFFFLRAPGDPQPSTPSTLMAVASPPDASPTTTLPAPVASSAPVASARPPSTPTPRPPPPPSPPPAIAPAAGDSRSLLRQGQFPAAAHGFAANLRKAARGTSSIQLLVACSEETIQKAVQQVDSAELYILPVSLKGRACYRMCWGVYPDGERAGSALRSLPSYFRDGGATPKVVPASELLP